MSDEELKWERRISKSKGHRPYKFTPTSKHPEYLKILQLFPPGKYSVIHNGRRYWIMRGGIGMREIESEPGDLDQY